MVHKDSGTAFISSILLSSSVIFTSSVQRAATNGVEILLNPDFTQSCTVDTLTGVLCHEVWHILLKHCEYMEKLSTKFQQKAFNWAGDFFINPTIKQAGLKLPKDHLDDPMFHGMSVHQIYTWILKHKPNLPDVHLDLDPKGLPDDVQKQLTPPEEVPMKAAQLIKSAATISKMQGTYEGLPDTIKIMVSKLMEPTIDLTTVLNNYVDGYAKDDYSYAVRNMWYPDFYAPSLYSEQLTTLVYAIDASGSVTDKEFNQFVAHIKYTMSQLDPKEVRIIVFDDYVIDDFIVHTISDLENYQFTGRGGTNLSPVFDLLNSLRNVPAVVVVLSDLYCAPIENTPQYPVIWACINNARAKVNFGTLLHFKVNR